MLGTTFLKNETSEYKEFSLELPKYLLSKKFIPAKINFYNEVINKRQGRIGCQNFSFSSGSVHLNNVNHVYSLEHIPHNTDLILPKNIKLTDWVVLHYEQTTTINFVSNDKKTPIKIRGNGNRIMGLDEPLICDMSFQTLRLTFLGEIDGWVVT
jgi:hypothetical protein